MSKELDLDTATREQLIEKIINQRQEINNLLNFNRRAVDELVRNVMMDMQNAKLIIGFVDQHINKIKKAVKGGYREPYCPIHDAAHDPVEHDCIHRDENLC